VDWKADEDRGWRIENGQAEILADDAPRLRVVQEENAYCYFSGEDCADWMSEATCYHAHDLPEVPPEGGQRVESGGVEG